MKIWTGSINELTIYKGKFGKFNETVTQLEENTKANFNEFDKINANKEYYQCMLRE